MRKKRKKKKKIDDFSNKITKNFLFVLSGGRREDELKT